MKINIISVGKLSSDYAKLAEHYSKMIKWKVSEKEITYAKRLPENQIKSYEAKLIEEQTKHCSYRIVLDVLGKQVSSEDFSILFKNQMMQARDVDIIIGGAFGLDESIINNSDIVLSLSKMTLPHQLAKLVLLEQIYRAKSILDGHPYHK